MNNILPIIIIIREAELSFDYPSWLPPLFLSESSDTDLRVSVIVNY
jgi:hypothetical protein